MKAKRRNPLGELFTKLKYAKIMRVTSLYPASTSYITVVNIY